MHTNKTCELTQGAIDIFQNLLWKEFALALGSNPSAKDFADRGIVLEQPVSSGITPYMTQSTSVNVYNVIQFIDIDSVMDLVFTKKDENRKVYQTVPIKPTSMISGDAIQTIGTAPDTKWLFNITRIDQRNFLDKCNELGNFNIGAGINICTES